MKYILIILCTLSGCFINISAQTSTEKLIRQGVSLHDKGQYKEAIEFYEKSLAETPSSMSAIYEMSLSYLQLKDYNKALNLSSKVIAAGFQPLSMDAYIVKGTALANMDKMTDAIKTFNEAVSRCGDEYLLHFNLGLCYFNNKNNQMAVLHLRKAIEIDATHASAFLLYGYALNDMGRWLQSFYSFHFFLLLEPNTERSKDVFGEMLDILNAKLETGSESLSMEEGVDRQAIYKEIQRIKAKYNNKDQYSFFVEASKLIFFSLAQLQNDTQSGLLWYFFVPTYEEILGSGHFDTYCKYISVTYFPESLSWWDKNKTQVDNFIEWFEHGQSQMEEEDEELGDDSDI